MTLIAPCLDPPASDAPCTVRDAVEEILASCLTDVNILCPGEKNPEYPYIAINLLDPGDPVKECNTYRYSTFLQVRIYTKSASTAKKIARETVKCLSDCKDGETLDARFSLPLSGFGEPSYAGAGVWVLQMNLPINIYQFIV